MKIILLIIFLTISFLSPNLLRSQYIIPDIGAPGMNIYVEFIADASDGENYFGSDDLYLNNEGDAFRITSSDPEKVTVGPFVVSWNGRMISTQVFINPNLDPQTTEQNDVAGVFKIELKYSAQDKTYPFTIVKPYNLDDVASGGAFDFGSGGNAGNRSQRGVMIVDSLILSDAEHTVSRKDPDGNINNGNQGYFPFILLSKGPVRGVIGGNTIISATAFGIDGGPGGGGGGGSFCDNSGSGSDGGNGFTGGGGGGLNNGSSSKRKKSGIGTGVLGDTLFLEKGQRALYAGKSFNGVAGSQTGIGKITENWGYESAGGGTGHPFGFSGYANSDGSECNNCNGQWGGGSGGKNLQRGGGGGYGSRGKDVSGSVENGGNVHGNRMGVPLAGGSGGASGNPQGLGCGGDGGGGGGAIRIFGSVVENINFYANGANGTNGILSADGGGGSGGFIEVSSKLEAKVTHTNGGGNLGGEGRYRIDAPDDIQDSDPLNYFGLSTDTTNIVNEKVKLTGSKNKKEFLKYYLKSASSGSWTLIEEINDNNSEWTIEFDLPEGDILFYGMAVQTIKDPVDGSLEPKYNHNPKYLLSQAAANIFILDEYPIIDGDDLITSPVLIACQNENPSSHTFNLTNIGKTDLKIKYDEATWKFGNRGFSLKNPETTEIVIPDGNSVGVIEFDFSSLSSGTYSDTLFIPNNTPVGDNDPWAINIEVELRKTEFQFFDKRKLQFVDMVEFINCESKQNLDEIEMVNRSGFNLSDLSATLTNGKLIAFLSKNELDVNEVATLSLSYPFDASEPEVYNTVYFGTSECSGTNYAGSIVVKIINAVPEITALSSDLDLEDSKINSTNSFSIPFTNMGNVPLYIDELPILNPPFTLTGSNPPATFELGVGETFDLLVDFLPTDEQDYSEAFSILTGSATYSCSESFDFVLKGAGIMVQIDYPDDVDFGRILSCDEVSQTITITNNSNFDVAITDDPIITNDANNTFTFVKNISAGDKLAKDEPVEIIIKFNENNLSAGTYSAKLLLKTDDLNLLEFEIDLFGEIEDILMKPTNDDYQINFGDLVISYPSANLTKQFQNYSNTFSRTFSEIVSSNSFTTSSFGKSFDPNVSKSLSFNLTIDKLGIYTEVIELVFDSSDDLAENCPESITMTIIANGVVPAITIDPNPLDFGVVPWCDNDYVKSLEFINNSSDDITITDDFISGDDKNIFFPQPFTGEIILSSESSTFPVPALGASLDIGNYSSTLNFTYLQNSQTISDFVELKIESQIGVSPSVDPLVYGERVLGAEHILSLDLQNIYDWDIIITDISDGQTYPNIFKSITDASSSINLGLGQNIEIGFYPDGKILYQDKIIVTFSVDYDRDGAFDECQSWVEFNVEGSGGDPVVFTISIDDILTDPRESSADVIISARHDKGTSATYNIENLTVSLNKTQFHPLGLSRGEIDNINYDDAKDLLNLAFKIDNVELSSSFSELTKIEGVPLLGNVKISEMNASNLVIEGLNSASFNVETGTMTSLICEEGGERLLKNNLDIRLDISAFEANGNINISASVIESGRHEIIISNSQGKIIREFDFTRKAGGKRKYEFQIDSGLMPPGVYFLRIESPWNSKTIQFMKEGK
jgi:hypothetical protein